jgi:S-adenosylmethionine synthetase
MLNLRLLEYSDDHKPQRIDAIVVSTQHDDFAEDEEMLAKIRKDIVEILFLELLLNKNQKFKHYLMTKLNIISIQQVNL